MTQSLAQRLKNETRALHVQAERSPLMGLLLRGALGRTAYCALLRNLHEVYAQLEPALARHAGHAALAPVHLPGLARLAGLRADLDVLHGPGWELALPLQPAALAYAQRLQQLDLEQPLLLLAHAYVRYLGDLSGGQVLGRMVAASLWAPPGAGTSFYDFGPPGNGAALARTFRAGLDRLVLAAPEAQAVVAEAQAAFGRHRQLFDELHTASGR